MCEHNFSNKQVRVYVIKVHDKHRPVIEQLIGLFAVKKQYIKSE